MTKKDNMPIWVFLALMSIETRKGASILVWSCIVFGLICIPLSYYQPFATVDWTWVAMMAGMSLWYWASMRWIDRHSSWPKPADS
ncbi:MAG: hypothetical protein OQL06_00150 [Gammaproteobacteria bacterium]|nr:hypothetical protein [Gammaproteobacteria bacterium]